MLRRATAGSLLLVVLTACGSSGPSGPTHAQLVGRLQQESGGKVPATDPALNCLAEVFLKYYKKADLESYLSGKLETFQDLPTPANVKVVNTAVENCKQLDLTGTSG